MRNRNMYNLTGLPGWVRFGYSPGWVGRGGRAPCQGPGQVPGPQAMPWGASAAGPGYRRQLLQRQAEFLEQQLQYLRQQVEELGSEE